MPGHVEASGNTHAHEQGEEGHAEETEAEADDEHSHSTVGNELFVSLGTTAVPYVIPSASFIWNLNSNPGEFLELRVDGDVPVCKKLVSLQPCALLGINLGYNTPDYYGWNNFQFGGQENVAWVNVGLNFAY